MSEQLTAITRSGTPGDQDGADDDDDSGNDDDDDEYIGYGDDDGFRSNMTVTAVTLYCSAIVQQYRCN